MIWMCPPCSTTNSLPLASAGCWMSRGVENPLATCTRSNCAVGGGGEGGGVLTLEPEPPQPEINSSAGVTNDPYQTRVHLHETSTNTFLYQPSPFCSLPATRRYECLCGLQYVTGATEWDHFGAGERHQRAKTLWRLDFLSWLQYLSSTTYQVQLSFWADTSRLQLVSNRVN